MMDLITSGKNQEYKGLAALGRIFLILSHNFAYQDAILGNFDQQSIVMTDAKTPTLFRLKVW